MTTEWGAEHPHVQAARDNLAQGLAQEGRCADAVALARGSDTAAAREALATCGAK
jgi:hypothetical protein